MIALGASMSLTRAQQDTVMGYIDSDRLVKEFVEPMVREPLTLETDRLQQELDAEIAKLPNGDENKKLEEAQALKNKYQAVLDQKKQELIAPLLAQTKTSIEKIADARGITMVLDNTYGLVIYGGVDLTEAVLQDLGSGK
jgi:Skp family chaperone for outer membrane proteins